MFMMICGECGGHSFGIVYGREVTDEGLMTYEPICLQCGEQPPKMILYDYDPTPRNGSVDSPEKEGDTRGGR